jgi:hypothetical protein
VKLSTLAPALLNLDYVCTLWTDVVDPALYVLHVPAGEVPSRGLHYLRPCGGIVIPEVGSRMTSVLVCSNSSLELGSDVGLACKCEQSSPTIYQPHYPDQVLVKWQGEKTSEYFDAI